MKRNIAALWTTVISCVGICGISSCSNVPFLVGDDCGDSNSPFAVNYNCANVDAGTDAESDANDSDAGTDGSSAIDEPGLESSVFSTPCKTECVPEASGPTAAGWSNEPFIVWFGAKSELATKNCPPETLYEKVRGFDKLVAPPAKCDACTCLANGSCTGFPTSIEIRSGKCGVNNVQMTPFDGPPNWDGSCTSVNAMAAGTLCNGVPCAQSVSTPPLPSPANEFCAPMVEKPTATLETHEWLEGALACRAKDLDGTCATTPEHCVNPLPDGWLRCVLQKGKHHECPGNYDDYAPQFVYQDNPIDNRGCSDCACGTPKDSICTGSLRVYSDASCTNELNNNQLASTDPFCVDLVPPGLALGSKRFGELTYWPGTCSVTGGEPIGTVLPNDDENSVTTICCRSSELPPLPPIR